MRKIRYIRAVSEAIEQEMSNDSNVIIMGEDVRHSIKGTMTGFVDKFGQGRVIDTPISEQGFHGVATGAAIMGFRPIIEYMIPEFVFFAFDQLIDQAQKLRYMSGGRLKIPVTYLVNSSGAKGSRAGQHSDNPYPYVLHGGMKVVMPSSAHDAKGLLFSAIRDDDPVMVFLPAMMLGVKGEVPEEEYVIPLGKGEIKKEGKDISVIATGYLVPLSIKTAEKLEEEGISAEVLDPRTLLPLDVELIKSSVAKTGRVVIIDDSNRTCGFAAHVSSIIAEECFHSLKAPIKHVTRADVPVPFAPPLEGYILPNEEKLINAIHSIL